MYFMSVNATFAVAACTRKVSRRPCTFPTTGKILILHKPLRRDQGVRMADAPVGTRKEIERKTENQVDMLM